MFRKKIPFGIVGEGKMGGIDIDHPNYGHQVKRSQTANVRWAIQLILDLPPCLFLQWGRSDLMRNG